MQKKLQIILKSALQQLQEGEVVVMIHFMVEQKTNKLSVEVGQCGVGEESLMYFAKEVMEDIFTQLEKNTRSETKKNKKQGIKRVK